MNARKRAIAAAPFLVAAMATLSQAEPSDISLEKEVARYLASAQGAAGDTTFRVFWKEGLQLETADKSFKLSIGGRTMVDWFAKSADGTLEGDFSGIGEDGVTFRRLRLHVKGTLYKNIDFVSEFEFAGTESPVTGVTTTTDGDGDVTSVTTSTTRVGSVQLRDVYLALRKVPFVGNVRVGHFKEPMGLEELTSSRYLTFMERSPIINAVAPAFNTGVMLHDAALEERLTWAVGVFRQTSEPGGGTDEDGAHALALRVTGLIVQDKERNLLVHLGVSFSLRDPSGGRTRLRARPSVATGPRVVDTGNISNDTNFALGFEFAMVYGAFSVQAEYLMAEFDTAGDPSVGGFYVMASFWLTGESRPYEASKGTFGRVLPKGNFHDGSGRWGAWEVAVRLTSMDFNDGSVAGGELIDVVVGLNWHLNPVTRVMFNFVFVDVDTSGEMTVIQMRFQIDF
ncbi:MAG: OprO/OprP family phosphate-selective porin [Planctomycetaceae bacterium]